MQKTRYEIEYKCDFTDNSWTECTQGSNSLSEAIATYVLNNDREQMDFENWCMENDLGLVITRKHLDHIYGQVLYFLHGFGYDLDYTIDVK